MNNCIRKINSIIMINAAIISALFGMFIFVKPVGWGMR